VAAAPGAIVGAALAYSAIFGLPASPGCWVSLAAAVLEGDPLSSSALMPMGGLPAVHMKAISASREAHLMIHLMARWKASTSLQLSHLVTQQTNPVRSSSKPVPLASCSLPQRHPQQLDPGPATLIAMR
jgi:hypothetical protein